MLNKVILMGRMTRDTELKRTNNDTAVCSFTLAIDRNTADKDGNRGTDFINCVAWRKDAEFVSKWFGKGQLVALEGSLQVRSYTDKDGKNRSVTEVVVDRMHFTGDKRERDSAPTPMSGVEEAAALAAKFYEVEDDGELPF